MNFSAHIRTSAVLAALLLCTSTPVHAGSWLDGITGKTTSLPWMLTKHALNFTVNHLLNKFNVPEFVGYGISDLTQNFINPTVCERNVHMSTGVQRFAQAEQSYRNIHSLPIYLAYPLSVGLGWYFKTYCTDHLAKAVCRITDPFTDKVCNFLKLGKDSWQRQMAHQVVPYTFDCLNAGLVGMAMKWTTNVFYPKTKRDEWAVARSVACAHCLREAAQAVPSHPEWAAAGHLTRQQLQRLADRTSKTCAKHKIT